MAKNKLKNKNARDKTLVESSASSAASTSSLSTATVEKHERFTLPVKEIKKDLMKNILFAIFSLGALVVLQKTGFGADLFHQFFRL